jgi:hypothetical protein
MKIYAAKSRYGNEFIPFAGKDLWVRVVSDYDFDFSKFRAGEPFWVKIKSIKFEPASYGLPDRYTGVGFPMSNSDIDYYYGDTEAAEILRDLDSGNLILHSFTFVNESNSYGDIHMVKPIDVVTTDELLGIDEE